MSVERLLDWNARDLGFIPSFSIDQACTLENHFLLMHLLLLEHSVLFIRTSLG